MLAVAAAAVSLAVVRADGPTMVPALAVAEPLGVVAVAQDCQRAAWPLAPLTFFCRAWDAGSAPHDFDRR